MLKVNVMNRQDMQTTSNKCACGCGSDIEFLDKYGRPRKFILGHHRRGRKLSEEQKNKMSLSLQGSKHWNWKNGRTVDKNGYIRILKPDHPFASKLGYVKEHRLVMEQYLGRYLEPTELVHHINENRYDNRIENLRVMTRGEHAIHHNIIDMTNRCCVVCNSKESQNREWHQTLDNHLFAPHWLCHYCYKRHWKQIRRIKKGIPLTIEGLGILLGEISL